MTSNVVEWENEKFLTYLKSVDEEAYEQFIGYKRMHEREVANNEADILLIKYGHLSNTEERYVSMNELKEITMEKGLDLGNLKKKDFLHVFNDAFKEQYAVVDSNALDRPSILIQWSEASHQLKSNTIMPYAEGNLKMERLEENVREDIGYFKTRYHLLFPKELDDKGKVSVVNMDRLDIGDGYYLNPHHQVRNEKNLSPELWEALENEVMNELLKTEKKDWINMNRKRVIQEMER
ncbi:LPD25 domain-containing protein [Siminovitchia sediminis]